MPIFLPYTMRLIFLVSPLWLFMILMLSFNYRFFVASVIIVKKSSGLISLYINAIDILFPCYLIYF